MNFISICSGIEAASVAFAPLGWKAIAFSEIEPFPCAVLAHHYPDVPNYGDMTKFKEWPESVFLEADAIVGGPPCQAFSVAGLRKGLTDARGNLTLTYVELINHADSIRFLHGKPPVIVLYENVPGLLSDKTNAFGCFLGALAGEDGAVIAPRGKWTDAGCVFGPQRTSAWRLFDAQYHAVAQRRRRVFVVASARKGFDPAAVLFEFDGVRRDTAPSRQAGQGTAHATAPCLTSSGRGVERTGDTRGQDPVVAVMQPYDVGNTLTARMAKGINSTLDEGQTPVLVQATTHTLRGEGFDASEDGTGRGTPLVPVCHVDTMPTMTAGGPSASSHNQTSGQMRDQYIVPVGVTIHGTDPTVQKVASLDETAQCLRARTPGNIDNSSTTVVMQPVAFAENSRSEVRLEGGDGLRTGAISTGGGKPGQGVPMIAFHPTQDPISSTDGSTHALGCGSSGGQASVAVAQAIGWDEELNASTEQSGTLLRGGQGGRHDGVLTPAMQVRRLTPVECERLQGFSDGHTAIPWRGKPAAQCPDGPRYKALGNSWAVPNVRWIGQRIAAHVAMLDVANDNQPAANEDAA